MVVEYVETDPVDVAPIGFDVIDTATGRTVSRVRHDGSDPDAHYRRLGPARGPAYASSRGEPGWPGPGYEYPCDPGLTTVDSANGLCAVASRNHGIALRIEGRP